MRAERGQATVEWVGLVLALAVVLGAAVRLRADPDEHGLADALASKLACAARDGCVGRREGGAPRPRGSPTDPAPAFTAPPLVPLPGRIRRPEARRAPRVLRGVWRRAWLACLAYERHRLNRRYPDTVLPGRAPPLREAVRVVRACLSPVP